MLPLTSNGANTLMEVTAAVRAIAVAAAQAAAAAAAGKKWQSTYGDAKALLVAGAVGGLNSYARIETRS
jgi:hypothetical protein